MRMHTETELHCKYRYTFNDSIPIIHGILLSHLETIFRVGSVAGS